MAGNGLLPRTNNGELAPLLAPAGNAASSSSTGNRNGSGGGALSVSSGSGAPKATTNSQQPHHTPTTLWIVVLVFLGLAAVTYKAVTAGALERFVLAVDSDPYGFLVLFIAFYIVSVVLLFPTMILQVLSGALYNFYVGLLVSWFATSVGQSLAFVLGRYLFRRSVKAYLLERVPNFPIIETAVKKEGWKLICLLRLSPILPYNVLNYAAALTPVPFLSYSLSSAIAIIPWTCLYVYLGTFTTNVADLMRGNVHYKHHATSGVEMLSSGLYGVLLLQKKIRRTGTIER